MSQKESTNMFDEKLKKNERQENAKLDEAIKCQNALAETLWMNPSSFKQIMRFFGYREVGIRRMLRL